MHHLLLTWNEKYLSKPGAHPPVSWIGGVNRDARSILGAASQDRYLPITMHHLLLK